MTEKIKTQEQNTAPVYAGLIKRSAAFIIDFCIIVIFFIIEDLIFINSSYIPNTLVIDSYPNTFTFKILFIYFILMLFVFAYYFIFEVKSNATLGKRLLGLEVLNEEGKSLTLKNKLWRFLFVVIFTTSLQIVSIVVSLGADGMCAHEDFSLPIYICIFCLIGFLCLFSYFSLLISSKKQTIYDRLTSCCIQDKKKSMFISTWLLLVLGGLFFVLYSVLLFFWIDNYGHYGCF